MSREKRGDQSRHQDAISQLELPFRSTVVAIAVPDPVSNVLEFRVKQPRTSNNKPDALDRILAYAETLAP